MKKAYNQYITEDFLKSRENLDVQIGKKTGENQSKAKHYCS